ncbi:MAG: DUF1598 domain-containing protein [Planctomyces sp.]|nr:DUF1598 domain-containing protein [Planctomyces sp.]
MKLSLGPLVILMFLVPAFIVPAGLTPVCFAQGGNQGGGNQGGGNQGGGGNAGGILINADGLVSMAATRTAPSSQTRRQMKSKATDQLSAELLKSRDLRKVSLKKLNDECARQLESSKVVGDTPEIMALAGLTRIDFVAIDLEQNDVIFAGPSEAFAETDGRLLGIESGRPTLHFEHLLAALRLPPEAAFAGCSFDPDPTRLVAARRILDAGKTPGSVQEGIGVFRRMAEELGNWNVSVMGVREDCRTALAMVEADYVLKRLTLGVDDPPVKGFRSQLASMKPGEDILRRWWFAAAANGIETNEDETLYRLTGPRIQLFGQDELVDENGQRTGAAVNLKSSYEYAKHFSNRIDALAEKVSAIAELQNIFDLMVVGAIVRKAKRDGLLLDIETLLDEQALPLNKYGVPKEVPSLGNARMQGRSTLLGLVGGGVRIEPRNLISKARRVEDPGTFAPLKEYPTSPEKTAWYWNAE